jgi:hypothetical protein
VELGIVDPRLLLDAGRMLIMSTLAQILRTLRAWRWIIDPPHQAAHREGLRLLKENLSADQRRQFARFDYFEVIGGDSGARYRIHPSSRMNIEQLDEKGERVRVLCFGPKGELPLGDTLLAQKIALESFERETLQIANALPPNRVLSPPLGYRF